MNTPTTLDYVTAIGSVATPVLVLVLTAIGWMIRKRIERSYELEEQLRPDRIEAYNEILEPFIILLTRDEAFENREGEEVESKEQIAMQQIVSLHYRQTAFKFALMGSDEVVRSYNDLMQFLFHQDPEQSSEYDVKRMMELLGGLLLNIRRSVGNKGTSLDNLEMLEWLIRDVRKLRD